MSNELVPSAQQEIATESHELSLHAELQTLRWLLRHEIETNGKDSRRAIALIQQLTRSAEAQARLGLLGGHVILRTALIRSLEDARESMVAGVREWLIDLFAQLKIDDDIEPHLQALWGRLLVADAAVSAESVAAYNREQGAR